MKSPRLMTGMLPMVGLAVGFLAADGTSEQHAAVLAARATFEKQVEAAVAPVRGRYIAELRSQLMREGDLQGVAAVDDELARLVEVKRLWERHALQGLWQVTYSNGNVRTYQIANTGDVRFIEEGLTGRINRAGNDVLLEFGDGKVERLTLQPALKLEHFDPRSAYPLGAPRATGTGVPTRR